MTRTGARGCDVVTRKNHIPDLPFPGDPREVYAEDDADPALDTAPAPM